MVLCLIAKCYNVWWTELDLSIATTETLSTETASSGTTEVCTEIFFNIMDMKQKYTDLYDSICKHVIFDDTMGMDIFDSDIELSDLDPNQTYEEGYNYQADQNVALQNEKKNHGKRPRGRPRKPKDLSIEIE